MPGIFSTYNTALKGLRSNSLATQTASNNIANADTKGYSRQRVILSESAPYNFANFQIGTGVDVNNIERIRDKYLDSQLWHEYANHGTYAAAQAVLEQSEIIFAFDDTGLNAAMDAMWNAWSDLAESPEGTNGRTIVLQATKTFTDMMNQMSNQIDTLDADTLNLIASKVDKVNSLIGDIQLLSDQIYKTSLKGVDANDLEDQRGVLLDELSALVNISVEYDEFSRIKITESDTGTEILGFNTKTPPAYKLSIDISTGEVGYDDGTDFTAVDLKNGEIAGNLKALSQVRKYKDSLDDLAFTVATTVNYVLTDGNTTGTPIFTISSGSEFTAETIQVNPLIESNVSLIRAGLTGTVAGDGSRALAISQLSETRLPIDVSTLELYLAGNYNAATMKIEPDQTGRTMGDIYEDIVSIVGSDLNRVNTGLITEEALIAKLEAREESISGVSIDEETVNLIKFADLYAANAKVISTLTEMMDTVLNMVR